MVSQTAKNLYWLAFSPLSILNLYCQRVIWRLRPVRPRLLANLGSGSNYLPGFVNVEGNLFLRKDLWLDIRFGLPFRPRTVDAIYLCHVLEHFDFSTGQKILKECGRVLRPGGGLRIVVPSLEKTIEAFNVQDVAWFPDWPDDYHSLGGRFNNYLLCRDQHRLMFDISFAAELLHSAGFGSAETRSIGASALFSPAELRGIEPEGRREFLEKSLIVEALQPIGAPEGRF